MNKIPLYVLVAISVASIAMIASSTTNTSPGVVSAIVPIMGHVTLTVQDDNGMIKQYVESDNAIVDGGEDCIAKLLFAPDSRAATTVVCTGALTAPFTTIQLGTDGTAAADSQTDLITPVTGSGLDLADGTVAWTNATGGDASKVVITKVFTATDTVSNIAETGLFNGTAIDTNGMFARNVFTPVSVSNGDTLTVTWTITVGN